MCRYLVLVLLALVTSLPACAADEELVITGTVTRVVDGDTLHVKLGSGTEKVRLHGVDTPEAKAPFGREATAALRQLVAGGRVELQPVSDDSYDRYDRLIAVVYASGVNVNAALVAEGHAWAYRRYLGEVEDDARLCDLEAAARTARKGLWSQPVERWVPPWIWRERQRAGPGAKVPAPDYANETAADCRAAIGKGQGRQPAR